MLSGFLAGLFLAALIIVNPILNGFVKPDFIESVNNTEGHNLKLDDISYSFFSNSLSFNGINYRFNNGERNINVTAPRLNVTSIPWLNLFTGGALSFGTIELVEPNILIEETESERVVKKEKEEIDLIDRIRGMLPDDHNLIEVGRLVITSGEIVRKSDNNPVNDSVKNADLILNGIYISRDTSDSSLPMKLFESAELNFNDIFKFFPENAYELRISSAGLKTTDSIITMKTVSYSSRKNAAQYFEGKQYRSNKYDIIIPVAEISGIDFAGVFWEDIIGLHKIKITGGNLEILTDKRVPRDPAVVPRMPHEFIKSLTYKLDIDKIDIENSIVSLREIWPGTDETSLLRFTNVNTKITNLRNSAGVKDPVVISAAAKLADEGEIKVVMKIPLQTDMFRMSCEGSLSSMSVLPLNSHLKIADRMELTSGMIKNVTFKVESEGDSTAAGIIPIYNDLKIKSLTGESEEGGIWQDIKSFFANKVKIRESNPDPDGKIKSGNIIFLKEKKNYFLDVVWYSLREASGEVVGF